jgi:hypothetical protein
VVAKKVVQETLTINKDLSELFFQSLPLWLELV